MDTTLLIADLNRVYDWDLATTAPKDAAPDGTVPEGPWSETALEIQLAEKINQLIQQDFGALVQLLYRIDVPEAKLRRMLDDNTGEDAGRLIARLIMERQWQKIETRRKYRRDGDMEDEPDVERW